MACGYSVIVLGLKFVYVAFYGQILKDLLPLSKERGLPKASHSAVAIGKGVNKHKFIMKYRR